MNKPRVHTLVMERFVVRNELLSKAALALAHPVTIAAVVLMLVNDHVLKHTVPSWWTGKLSDLAWMVFSPLLATLVLALLFPTQSPQRQRQIAAVASVSAVVAYALFNLSDPAHTFFVSILEVITRWDLSMPRDPTDIISLPAAFIGWRVLWRPAVPKPSMQALGLVMLGVTMLASVATSEAERDLGIDCLVSRNSALYAMSYSWERRWPDGDLGRSWISTLFISMDGGRAWQEVPREQIESEGFAPRSTLCNHGIVPSPEPYLALEDNGPSPALYRFWPGESIERSTDGGTRWVTEFDLSALASEVRQEHYRGWINENREGVFYPEIVPGPLEVILNKGNVLAAMGHDGVLVRPRTEAGEWEWVAVGPYKYQEFSRFSYLGTLLIQALAGVGTAFLVLGTTVMLGRTRRIWSPHSVIHLLVWIPWLWLIGIQIPVDIGTALLVIPLTLSLPVILITYGIFGFINSQKVHPRGWLASLIFAISSWALFMLPLVIWTQDGLSSKEFATGVSMALSVLLTVGGVYYVRTRLRAANSPVTSDSQ